MEDKLPKIKYAYIGVNPEEAQKLSAGKRKLAAETICIFYEDKTAEIIDISGYSLEEKEKEVTAINALIRDSITNVKNYKSLHTNSKEFQKIIAKAEKIIAKQDKKEPSKLKKALVYGGLVAGGLALGVAGAKLNDGFGKSATAINQTLENNDDIPEIEGKDFAFYSENAIDTKQKQLVLGVNKFLTEINGKEDWSKVTLNEKQMEQYNLTDPECIFGFTAEDMYALALRFGHYSNDDYVTLTGGTSIDVTSIMDDAHSQSNGALSSIITYYVCSEKCDLNIENIINFNEKEVSKINEIESLLAEYKTLEKEEGKEKEAEAKMHEIKTWINEFAYNVDYELDNAKSYILRTFLPACSIISEMHQYTDTARVTLYDTKKEANTTKEIKTDLFDEIMMRNLVLGYNENGSMGAFDAESYLEEHGIDNKKYNLLNTDVERSKADQSVSGQLSRLEEANEHIANLRSENTQAETIYYATNQEENVNNQTYKSNNVQTKYDELTYGTYEPTVLFEIVNNYLKQNNIYPKNMNYFRTARIAEIQIEYKDTHGITAGKKGDTIKTENHGRVEVGSVTVDPSVTDHVILDKNGNVTTEDKLKEEAKKEHEENTGIKDATTPEASEKADEEAQIDAAARAQMLQGVYNATFNYYNGGPVVVDGFDTSNTYGQSFTTAWATSSDADIVANYNAGMADGLKFKSDREEANKQPEIIETKTETIVEDTEKVEETTPEVTETSTEVVENPESEDEYTTEEPIGFAPVVEEETENNTELEGEYTTEEPVGFAPVVEDPTEINLVVNNVEPINEIEQSEQVVETTEVSLNNNDIKQIQQIEQQEYTGEYTTEPPVGFAPVVSEAEIDAYLNTEEGMAFLAELTQTEQTVETTEVVKTK